MPSSTFFDKEFGPRSDAVGDKVPWSTFFDKEFGPRRMSGADKEFARDGDAIAAQSQTAAAAQTSLWSRDALLEAH